MMHVFKSGFLLALAVCLSMAVAAQTKKPRKPAKTTVPVVTVPAATPAPKTVVPPKRNERPAGENSADVKANGRAGTTSTAVYVPVYFYEFARPGFTYSRVLIEHDEAGKGKISFLKDGFDEMISDPVSLSASTIKKIGDALAELNFLDSNENYQHVKDFSHMGNITLTMRKNGRERTVKYNWTENKNAKLLMDEYRRVGNEYTWRFEMLTARENYPLQTPGLMDAIDGYLKRDEISDPAWLRPFLTELSIDERLPLMARNHAAKLVAQIDKARK